MKLKVDDAYSSATEWGLKWELTGIFHTKFSNDRFISLIVQMSDNVMDEQLKSVTDTVNL